MQSIIEYFTLHGDQWVTMVIEHLAISGMALAAAALIAVPLGIACSAREWAVRIVTNLAGILRVVPSLGVLIICVPLIGVGDAPAVIALTVLAIPPILINTILAFRELPTDVLEAARAMGMGTTRLLFTIKLPLALPTMFAGVRTAATEVIASASLAAYIGAGGLGVLIYTGIDALKSDLLWIGGLSVAALSLAVGALGNALDRRLRQRLGA